MLKNTRFVLFFGLKYSSVLFFTLIPSLAGGGAAEDGQGGGGEEGGQEEEGRPAFCP